jgi:hypothetical protein
MYMQCHPAAGWLSAHLLAAFPPSLVLLGVGWRCLHPTAVTVDGSTALVIESCFLSNEFTPGCVHARWKQHPQSPTYPHRHAASGRCCMVRLALPPPLLAHPAMRAPQTLTRRGCRQDKNRGLRRLISWKRSYDLFSEDLLLDLTMLGPSVRAKIVEGIAMPPDTTISAPRAPHTPTEFLSRVCLTAPVPDMGWNCNPFLPTRRSGGQLRLPPSTGAPCLSSRGTLRHTSVVSSGGVHHPVGSACTYKGAQLRLVGSN